MGQKKNLNYRTPFVPLLLIFACLLTARTVRYLYNKLYRYVGVCHHGQRQRQGRPTESRASFYQLETFVSQCAIRSILHVWEFLSRFLFFVFFWVGVFFISLGNSDVGNPFAKVLPPTGVRVFQLPSHHNLSIQLNVVSTTPFFCILSS